MTKNSYTRKEIESMKTLERPQVRVKYTCDYIDEDGRKTEGVKETTGRIIIDGNNPWIEIHAAGKQIAERFSWELVLEVLNDPYATPIWFNERVEYEV